MVEFNATNRSYFSALNVAYKEQFYIATTFYKLPVFEPRFKPLAF